MAKQSDHIDNRFREAADNISVPPNPLAWEKMEQLLDAEKRRRPVAIWWFLLPLLLAGGAAVYIYHNYNTPANGLPQTKTAGSGGPASSDPSVEARSPEAYGSSVPPRQNDAADVAKPQDEKPSTQPDENDQTTSVPVVTRNGSAGLSNIPARHFSQPKKKPVITEPSFQVPGSQKRVTDSDGFKAKSKSSDARLSRSGDRVKDILRSGKLRGSSTRDRNLVERQLNDKTENSSTAGLANSNQTDIVTPLPGSVRQDSASAGQKDPIVDKKSAPALSKDAASPHPRTSVADSLVSLVAGSNKWELNPGFSISVAGKVDATALHHISLHEFKTLFGAGLAYRFSNRLSVQTGAFIQRAIYFAGPEDYKVKSGTYLSMYKISKVDANCLFYEIPLNLRYDFLIGKGFRLYSTAGANSYIMKNESYRYHATGAMGYRMFDSTYTTNRNVLASLFFSAGIEKKLTRSFSVQAEPYITLPNSGLGAGKVKLYSSGLQLSVKFQPSRMRAKVKK